jgi:hypothetical protein
MWQVACCLVLTAAVLLGGAEVRWIAMHNVRHTLAAFFTKVNVNKMQSLTAGFDFVSLIAQAIWIFVQSMREVSGVGRPSFLGCCPTCVVFFALADFAVDPHGMQLD